MGKYEGDLYKGSSFWNEEKGGRIDEDGNIYEGSSYWNEEKVGRIDEDGNIYKGSSYWNEEKVGRVDDDGIIHKGSSYWTEERSGRIDEDRNIYEGSSYWNEEKSGRLDDGGSSSSGCFIATACAVAAGLPSDCEELTALREFRNNFMAKKPEGLEWIRDYQTHAPSIVAAIEALPNKRAIYDDLFHSLIEAVRAIRSGNPESALSIYQRKYRRLKEMFVNSK